MHCNFHMFGQDMCTHLLSQLSHDMMLRGPVTTTRVLRIERAAQT